jgi:septin family protein
MLHYLGYGLLKVKLLQAMKHLHDKVNVIPVIGKSDACTQDEIRRFKSAVSFSE